MSNSSYTIWIELLTCEISQTKLLPNELSIAYVENSLNFIWIHHHFTNPHWKSIYFCFSFTIWFITCANFVTKKNLIFWKESTKRTLFYNKNAGYKQHFQKLKLVIITARKWYRNSTHLEMNYKSFNLFTILHPKKQKYTNRSKQTNKRFKFYFQILNSQTVEIHWAFRNWERKEIWGSKLVPDGWNSRRDLKDK